MEGLRLDDEVIANIAKIIQVAILTGTDIVDNLRMIRLEQAENSYLTIHPDYREQLKTNLNEMLNAIEKMEDN